ncbi:hypothetical protein L210DRAFT_3402238, partial [Boletus edulis BED1]
HFKNGISTVKQWTASDHKQLELVFLGALVGVIAKHCVLHVASCLIDFVYLAQYQSHTNMTLATLQDVHDEFHRLKDIFIQLGCREHFNIPKFHSLMHYADTIKNLAYLITAWTNLDGY